MRLTILHLACWLSFGKASRDPGLSATPRAPRPLQSRFSSQRLLALPKSNIAVERGEICEGDGHTVHMINQQRLSAD